MSVDAISSSITVLVVEDELLVRMNTVAVLEDEGFNVLQASNADEAIRLLEQNLNIHLIFTDINMPGSMDGLKLAHFVRHRWPPVRIIVTSAHFNMTDDNLPDGAIFLPKPYSHEHVTQGVRKMVSGIV